MFPLASCRAGHHGFEVGLLPRQLFPPHSARRAPFSGGADYSPHRPWEDLLNEVGVKFKKCAGGGGGKAVILHYEFHQYHTSSWRMVM